MHKKLVLFIFFAGFQQTIFNSESNHVAEGCTGIFLFTDNHFDTNYKEYDTPDIQKQNSLSAVSDKNTTPTHTAKTSTITIEVKSSSLVESLPPSESSDSQLSPKFNRSLTLSDFIFRPLIVK